MLTAILIIVVGLIISLYDKTDLFTPPITIKKIAVILAFIIATGVSGINGCNDEKENQQQRDTINALNVGFIQ